VRSLILLALFFCAPAIAGDVWLQVPLASYHFDRTNDEGEKYNQRNFGIGLEYAVSEKFRLQAGMYRNSLGLESGYVGASYLPWSPFRYSRIGVSAGVVSGYDENVIPVVIPTLSIEGKKLGANILFVPETSQTKGGGLGLILKWKLE